DEFAKLGIAAAGGQRHAVGPQPGGAPLQAVLALREVEARGARQRVQALDLVGELALGREQRVEAPQVVGPAAGGARAELLARLQALEREALRGGVGLERRERGEVEHRAREEHADAGDAHGSETSQHRFQPRFHRASRIEAWIENCTGCCGSSRCTWWLTRCTSASKGASASRRTKLNIASRSFVSAGGRSNRFSAAGWGCRGGTSLVGAAGWIGAMGAAHGRGSWRTPASAARASSSSRSRGMGFAGRSGAISPLWVSSLATSTRASR